MTTQKPPDPTDPAPQSAPKNDAPSSPAEQADLLDENVIKWLVEVFLFALWLGDAAVLVYSIVSPLRCPCGTHSVTHMAIALAVVGLCLLPQLLAYSVARLAKWRQQSRCQHRFQTGPLTGDSRFETDWKKYVQPAVEGQWRIEALRANDAQRRMGQYGTLFGFVATVSLSCCALILNEYRDPRWAPAAVALAVAGATAVCFSMNLGRVIVRAARRDASARMFAWAARTEFLVIAATVLLVSLAWQRPESEVVRSSQGFLLIGLAVAAFGEQALQAIAERAATALSLTRQRVQTSIELGQIQGLGEEDIVRLGEEGIDTLHALAFMPTPQLYFNTPYSLHRICDWQDQALLIIYTGTTKAVVFREQLLIRGAMDAQRLAEWFLFQDGGMQITDKAEPASERTHIIDTVTKALGFTTEYQARAAMHTLAGDETIHRLRLYVRGRIEMVR